MSLVSIIIPVYNAEKYIAQTLRSVRQQTHTDFEVWVIDDGSTDSGGEIVKAFIQDDPRFFYIRKNNTGVSDTRNIGLERATGEYIVFMDADDIAGPGFLASRVSFLNSNRNVAICGSRVLVIDDSGEVDTTHPSLTGPGHNMQEEILLFREGVVSIPSNLMHRRSVWMDHHIRFDSRVSSSADRLVLARLALVARCHSIEEANMFYRVHAQSMYNDPRKIKEHFADGKKYVSILEKEKLVPADLRLRFQVKNYYVLAGMAWKAGFYRSLAYYLAKYTLARLLSGGKK